MNIIPSCRNFLYLARLSFKLKIHHLPSALLLYCIKGRQIFPSRWNSLFSKVTVSRSPALSIIQSPGRFLPDPEMVSLNAHSLWGYVLSGRYLSPSNPDKSKEKDECCLSTWFFWAHKNNMSIFCRFFDDETVEIFLVEPQFTEKFRAFYSAYNPFYRYAHHDSEIPLWCFLEKGWKISDKQLAFEDFASLYVISLHDKPVRFLQTVDWQSPEKCHFRTHIEFTKIFEIVQSRYSDTLPAVLLNPFQGHGIQWVNLFDHKIPVKCNSLKAQGAVIDYKDFCSELSPDRYQRHKMAAHILLEAAKKNDCSASLADFGGNPGLFHNFLPSFDITVIDREPLDYPFHILFHTFNFAKKGQFDYTTAIDVLEHIIPEERTEFISKVFSVSRFGSIISFPAYDEKIHTAEKILFKFEKEFLKRENHYLAEHLQHPLPDNQEMEEVCRRESIPAMKIPNGWLPHWFYMMFLNLLKEFYPRQEIYIQNIFRNYNIEYSAQDNRFPAYRTIWLLGDIAETGKNLYHKTEFEKQTSIQWNPLTLDNTLQSYGLNEAAEWVKEQKDTLFWLFS